MSFNGTAPGTFRVASPDHWLGVAAEPGAAPDRAPPYWSSRDTTRLQGGPAGELFRKAAPRPERGSRIL